MTGVREYICLHFGSDEARTTMTELEEWSHDRDPQPCYLNILRRLFPDIKPKVLQLLLAACDIDFIKTIETILPCCKKLKSNGHVTYIKASAPPQKMMMLSRTKYPPTRIHHHEKPNVRRFSPYATMADRIHARCPPIPGMFVPPYPVASKDNCGLCVPPGYLPQYYYPPGPRISSGHKISPRAGGISSHYTTPAYNFPECKTVTSHNSTIDKDDTRTSAAATLISLSNS